MDTADSQNQDDRAAKKHPSEVLVEVRLADQTFLLPCNRETTVSSLSTAAMEEYRSYQFCTQHADAPRTMLYTRDSNNRVLCGSLRIIDHDVDRSLEVVLQSFARVDPSRAVSGDGDYSGNSGLTSSKNSDSSQVDLRMSPDGAERLLRDWQYWAVVQVREYIQQLSFHDVPPAPDATSLQFLHELSQSPAEKVQLQALRTLQLLMTKFPQRDVVLMSAESISALFERTAHAAVAIDAIGAFRGLSPLQLQVLDGGAYVRSMFDVQRALCRFSEQHRGLLYRAFESISGILEDDELQKVLADAGSTFPSASEPVPPAAPTVQQQQDFIEYHVLQSPIDSNVRQVGAKNSALYSVDEAVDVASPKLTPVPSNAAVHDNSATHSAGMKRINLKRLESLLASDDGKVRQYALEKLHKLLLVASTQQKPKTQQSLPPAPLHLADAVKGEAAFEETSTTGSKNTAISLQEYNFVFVDAQEVESLLATLCRCLKRCIQRQPLQGKREGRMRENEKGNDVASGLRQKRRSTASRLIRSSLESPQSDAYGVGLVVDCLWLVVHFPIDVEDEVLRTAGKHLNSSNSSRILQMSGERMTNMQWLFSASCREWYRLLLTLSHADEGENRVTDSRIRLSDNTRSFSEISEKSAYLFQLVVLHGMRGSWRGAGLQLEPPAVADFLSLHHGREPSFRSYLALHYTLSLAVQLNDGNVDSTSAKRLPHYGTGCTNTAAAAELEALLCHDNCAVLHALWQWAVGNNLRRRATAGVVNRYRYHRTSSLMAMGSIASCSVFSSVQRALLTMNPLTQLAKLITIAVRDPAAESEEFSSSQRSIMIHGGGAEDDCEDNFSALLGTKHSEREGDDFFFDVSLAGDEDSDVDLSDDDDSQASESNSSDGSDDGDAVRRFLTRHRIADSNSQNSAPSQTVRVYPDLALLRQVLKCMANLLLTAGANNSVSRVYKQRIGQWLSSAEILPPPNASKGPLNESKVNTIPASGNNTEITSDRRGVKLRRVAKRDPLCSYYYQMLTTQLQKL